MAEEETLSAVISIIRGIARNVVPAGEPSTYKLGPKNLITNGCDAGNILLQGTDIEAKRCLEKEVRALVARVQYLEAKASTVDSPLPETPEDLGTPSSPFSTDDQRRTRQGGRNLPGYPRSGLEKHTRVDDLLAADTKGDGGRRVFTDEELGHLRDHVAKQDEELQGQRATMSSICDQVSQQQVETQQALAKVQDEDISGLQRELLKHQKANEAFQKALKEIGTIITNVANGDLSHKVQIHDNEMNPEITAFKLTINTMMDQLQVFGSEVSRVAREVGTEGILGGQAKIAGVSGIWKELTGNGKYRRPKHSGLS